MPDEGGDDLFGDDDDQDNAGSDRGRAASDGDLGSDLDDLEPRGEDGYDTREVREKVIYGVEIFRHRTPKSSDGTVCAILIAIASLRECR